MAWKAADRVETYFVWVDNLTTGETGVWKTRTSDTSITATSDMAEGRYRFWVKAENTLGHAWSQSQDFVIDGAVTTPEAPVLSSPTFGANGEVQFTWNPAVQASRYFLWVNDARTNQPVFKLRTYDASAVAQLTPGDYRFWVKAENSLGGQWSSALDFSVS